MLIESTSRPDPAVHAWQRAGAYTLVAVREVATGARGFLADHGLPESELAAWELILTEAANNCVIHCTGDATDESWQMRLVLAADRVIARIQDGNECFVWPHDPQLPDEDAESGRGLFLIHSLTDFRKYECHPGGNILTLERRFAPAAPAEDLEATLDAMTEELASCYESLSAIFRFTAEARSTTRLEDFAASLLHHLSTVTASDFAVLRIVANEQLITLASHGCEAPPACGIHDSSNSLEAAAVSSRQDQWLDSGENDFRATAGLVHPFYHEDELMGVISLGRQGLERVLNAGEVSIIHTFSEFLTQQMLSRRHEEQAIRSSVARREFELAAAIQQSLLPPPLPAIAGVSFTGHCESALSIGGDFYDVIACGNDGYFFVIADVMGKGVAASMIAAVCRSTVRAFSEYFTSPARLMEKVALQMHDDLERLEMFVTVAVGIVDVPEGVIRISNAGHCPVVIGAPDGSIIEVGPDRPPIGIGADSAFAEHEIPLTRGMRILAYTDGLVDPRNQRPSFETQPEVTAWFQATMAQHRQIEVIQSSLLDRLGHRSDPNTLADDQTFIVVGFE